jgi:pyruvate dehydrogenase E2 component (dihydrolipoyllysine-residue acetyltransferase)
MEFEFRIPELGVNVEHVDVLRVYVSVGDIITDEQPVLEIDTDKAVIEMPSPWPGRITQVFVKEGDSAKIGDAVLRVEIITDNCSE